MGQIPTIWVTPKNGGQLMMINKLDFDLKLHKKAEIDAKGLPVKAKKAKTEAKTETK